MYSDIKTSKLRKFAGGFYRAACRYHLLEVVLEDVFNILFFPASTFRVSFFDILRSKWSTLDLFATLIDSLDGGLRPMETYQNKALLSFLTLSSVQHKHLLASR